MDKVMARTTLNSGGTVSEAPTANAQASAPASAVEFETLYRRHYRDVYRYVLVLTSSVQEAEDISAETFERAFRAWSDGQPPAARPGPWLLLTARRIATDRWRRMRRMATIAPSLRDRQTAKTDEVGSEFWLWFDALAEALPDRQREVLLLRYRRDLSDADIASIMGLSESGIRSLTARALAALRAHPELLT